MRSTQAGSARQLALAVPPGTHGSPRLLGEHVEPSRRLDAQNAALVALGWLPVAGADSTQRDCSTTQASPSPQSASRPHGSPAEEARHMPPPTSLLAHSVAWPLAGTRSEEHTSELQSQSN